MTQALGKVAVAHSFARKDTLELLNIGINGLTYIFFDEQCNEEVVAAFKKAGAWLQQRYAIDERVKDKLTEAGRENLCRCMGAAKEGATVQNAYDTVRRLKMEEVSVILDLILLLPD